MPKMSTAAQRRLKKQRQKERLAKAPREVVPTDDDTTDNVEVEYIPESMVVPDAYGEFEKVFRRFAMDANDPFADAERGSGGEDDRHRRDSLSAEEDDTSHPHPHPHALSHSDVDSEAEEESKISNKQLRKQSRMSLAALKQYARHPEVVEWEDVTAKDPRLLVQLKSLRHSVPVPRHWCQKRKYLSGKRGYVKPPFELPAFIRDTGITEMRDTMRSQDATKRIKVKAREKMHPKLGRLTVDYERLYDAFFKYQTKPPLSSHGDLYFEGKEFAGAITGGTHERKPGILSEKLRAALGMTSHVMPPPWLHAMQKYGPPPSYPHMRIPGLNAPIPEGAQWGYHPGGWGKPPVDNFMRDLPVSTDDPVQLMLLNPIERNLWGELEPDEEEPHEEDPNQAGGAEGGDIVAIDEETADNFLSQPPQGLPPPPLPLPSSRDSHGAMSDLSDIVEVRPDRRRRS